MLTKIELNNIENNCPMAAVRIIKKRNTILAITNINVSFKLFFTML